jgi:type IV secretion system protein VirB3
MQENDALDTAPVFLALTKPPMMMGVVYDYFLISVLIVMCGFILSGNFLSLVLFLPLHLLGLILTALDPHIFNILSVRATLGSGKNARFWGCESYEPY